MSNDLDKHELSMDVAFNIKEILDAMLESIDSDGLIDVIKYIDAEMCDIDFTKEAHEYFAEQVDIDENSVDPESVEKEGLDVVTTIAIIKGIIVATHKNKDVIHGVLDYIQEIEDNA